MRRLLPILLPVAALAALAFSAPMAAAGSEVGQGGGFAPHRLLVKLEGQKVGSSLSLPPGAGVREAARALRRNPRVLYAAPDYVATASAAPPRAAAFDPDDPGTLGAPSEPSSLPGGWASKQWDFLAPEGPATPQLPTSPGGIDAVHRIGHAHQIVGKQQIALPNEVVKGMLRPGRVGKAAVAGRRGTARRRRLRLVTQQPARRQETLPQGKPLIGEAGLDARHRFRIEGQRTPGRAGRLLQQQLLSAAQYLGPLLHVLKRGEMGFHDILFLHGHLPPPGMVRSAAFSGVSRAGGL